MVCGWTRKPKTSQDNFFIALVLKNSVHVFSKDIERALIPLSLWIRVYVQNNFKNYPRHRGGGGPCDEKHKWKADATVPWKIGQE